MLSSSIYHASIFLPQYNLVGNSNVIVVVAAAAIIIHWFLNTYMPDAVLNTLYVWFS